MDQAHNAFVPHILIVQAGTSVLFPNNDVVSHHVYSFSEPKTFEFPLYKGNAHPPLVFDRPGRRRARLQHSRQHARLHSRRRHTALRVD